MDAETAVDTMLQAINRASSIDYEIDEIINATGRLICAHQPPDGLAREEWRAAADQLLAAIDRLAEDRSRLLGTLSDVHRRAEQALAWQ